MNVSGYVDKRTLKTMSHTQTCSYVSVCTHSMDGEAPFYLGRLVPMRGRPQPSSVT